MRSKNIRESLDQEHIQNRKREKSNDFNEHDQQRTRSIEQVSFFIFNFQSNFDF
jgi:hypothetical protein